MARSNKDMAKRKEIIKLLVSVTNTKEARNCIEAGADIIDIGAASSRPNAKEIDETEEWLRLEPVLKELRKKLSYEKFQDLNKKGLI